jgi:hypothetical protein
VTDGILTRETNSDGKVAAWCICLSLWQMLLPNNLQHYYPPPCANVLWVQQNLPCVTDICAGGDSTEATPSDLHQVRGYVGIATDIGLRIMVRSRGKATAVGRDFQLDCVWYIYQTTFPLDLGRNKSPDFRAPV